MIVAQEQRQPISGIILHQMNPVENVHILNYSAHRGSLSDKNGKFKISVKKNDTLIFSDIQFITKLIIIKDTHINNNELVVLLKTKNNQLDEVVIESKNMAEKLGLPNAGKKPLTHIERQFNYINKGGVIDKIYALISGDKKKLKKLNQLIEEDRKRIKTEIDIQLIRNHFHDDFFIKKAGISKDQINAFIEYCIKFNIIPYYYKGNDLAMINIFLRESKLFKNKGKDFNDQ